MSRHSVRFRLTIWYAVVLTAGLGLFSGLIWISLRQQMLADMDRELAGSANRLEAYFKAESAKAGVNLPDELEEFCQALPSDSYVTLRGDDGFSFHFPVKTPVPPEPTRMITQRFELNGHAYNIEVGTPTADLERVLELLRLLLWSLIPVVIAIACVGGVWLSGRALKPVQDVTAAALMIGIDNLSGRVPVPQTGDEIAKLAEVLNSMLARLETAVKTLSQFAADASHELRTPLAVIRTTAELALRRARSPESYRESLESVVAEVDRMTRLVEDLLTLARIDGRVADMPPSNIDLKGILQDVCSEMRTLADRRGIRIRTEIGNGPAIVSGHAAPLHRLFLVLLDNAVKYSHPGGEVFVKLTSDALGEDSRIFVAIQDSGIGISPSDLPRIFDRFFRSERTRGNGGHGLGLPLADSIARAHGARIEVESEEDKGSRFVVVFRSREASPEWSLYQPPNGALAAG